MKIFNSLALVTLCSLLASTVFAQAPKPYSDFVASNGLVFVSGQIGTKVLSTGKHSFSDEVHETINNISQILNNAGLGLKDAVSVTVYLKNVEQFSTFNEIYQQYFKNPFPARTCVFVKDLIQQANIEITVVAGKKQ